MVTAIFAAAGQGRRMELGVNKIFLELDGRPILIHTLQAFSACDAVDDLLVVVAPDEVPVVKALLANEVGLKPYKVAAGGAERQHSVANALRLLPPETEIVLVHDGARPLVPRAVIERVAAEALASGAAAAGVPEKNTIKVVDGQGWILSTPDRKALWSIQTPQGFRREVLLEAYARAEADGFLGTDDAGLVERSGRRVKVVMGAYRNLKITTPEDMVIAEAFVRQAAEAEGRDR